MKITLDTNCLVDLELNEGAYLDLLKIISSFNSGKIDVYVPGIGASERLKGGSFADSFTAFQERLKKLSLRELIILRPLCYLNITFIEWSIRAEDEMIGLERDIHKVLFPDYEFIWADQAKVFKLDPNVAVFEDHKESKKWRNRKCDVLGLWCHIFYGNDIFVTRDNNFHKETKKPSLIKLGAKNILLPSEVIY